MGKPDWLNWLAKRNLLLLDWILPGIDGLEVYCRLRVQPAYTPIIIVSSKAAETHRIVGLEMDADDYICKPFFCT